MLIESVAEKTGYPPEMLDLDMRLDTDLGIDSIKRVEILSAVQERLPNAPAIGPAQLGCARHAAASRRGAPGEDIVLRRRHLGRRNNPGRWAISIIPTVSPTLGRRLSAACSRVPEHSREL